MRNLKTYNKYIDIVKEFKVFIVKTNKNKYEIKLEKRPGGPKPPRITLEDLARKIDELDRKLTSRLDGIVKANHLIDPSMKQN